MQNNQKIKIGINGFGRIGRLALRIINQYYCDQLEVITINDLTNPSNLAYLYNYDTTYGYAQKPLSELDGKLILDNQTIKVYANKEPTPDQWQGVDILLECSGFYLTTELCNLHLKAGAKKILISAPAKDDLIETLVLGVNDHKDFSAANIISNASCTTNCITPILRGLLDNQFTINGVDGVTVHAVTNSQSVQDGVSAKDFRSGRAAYTNLIPTKTGAQKATAKLIPELEGKLSISSLRVPIMTGSVVYLNITTNKVYKEQEVNLILTKIAAKHPKLINFSTNELVSSDIVQSSYSVTIDSLLTKVNGNVVSLVLWYDNEWGYTNRLVEMALLINLGKNQ
jgi:glyceraldehyde 3-phosphate dehydrogenase